MNPPTQTQPSKAVIPLNKKKPETVRDWVATDEFKNQVALALPRHLTPDRFVRIALTALMRTPKLALCTKESVFQCLLDLSALGLEPDGRRAHLIPFEDRKNNRVVCTLIVDYKGLVDVVRRSGEISYIHADVVYDGDEFDYLYGTGAFLKHKPSLKERGLAKCVYSFVKLKDGSEDFSVMDIESVNKVRNRSRAANNGPWVTDWDEMAKKTVFRRQSKWLPFSPELREQLEKDDEALTESERFERARPIAGTELPEVPEFTGPEPAKALEPQRERSQMAPDPEPEDDGGLGPEKGPGPTPPPDEPNAPTEPQVPRMAIPADSSESLKALVECMFKSNVTEAQVLAWCLKRKISKPEQSSLLELSDSKIQSLVDKWNDISKGVSVVKEKE